jgi:hypothetical protein
MNGDGTNDFAVGVPYSSKSAPSGGALFIFAGAASGPYEDYGASLGLQTALYGFEVIDAGDQDGDGHDDLAVTAAGDGANPGFIQVVYGGSAAYTPGDTISGPADGGNFGQFAANVGDLDGDGRDDLLVKGYTSATKGAVYLVYGGDSTYTDVGLVGSQAYGHHLTGAGDVNGDGFPDALVGEPWLNFGEGELLLGDGSAFSSQTQSLTNSNYGQGDWLFYDGLGVGDIDSDGFDDVLVGSGLGTRRRSTSAPAAG